MPTDNEQINLAMCGPAGEHEHVYEPTFRLSRLAGTPHRQCTVEGCRHITLDSEECDCGDFGGCSDCHAWAEEQLAAGFSPWSLKFIEPGDVIEPLPPKWY
jgi:hypothetical protein